MSLEINRSILYAVLVDPQMNTRLETLLVVALILTGCAGRETRSVTTSDYTHYQTRLQLQEKPVSLPSETPYDADSRLRSVFASGYKKGWDVVLGYWLGNAIVIPEKYRRSAAMEEAWVGGWKAGQQAAYQRVLSLSEKTAKP